LAYFILKDKQTCPELICKTIWKYQVLDVQAKVLEPNIGSQETE